MMVIFVSQCEKNALKKTRRVLDVFADRIGDNTWQTIITQEGLNAVKKLLRKTASKNTAVSGRWIRSRSRSELIWVVGNRNRFNALGLVPTNTTRSSYLHKGIENDWHYLPLIKALVAMAALFHDWGKATVLFQRKLASENKELRGDPIRHEWVSCLLLKGFIQLHGKETTDDQWLTSLAEANIDEKALCRFMQEEQQQPNLTESLGSLPPIACLVIWLVVSHHRLPNLQKQRFADDDKGSQRETIDDYKGCKRETIPKILSLISKEWGYENKDKERDYQTRLKQCFQFEHGLLSGSSKWLKEVKQWSDKLASLQSMADQAVDDGSIRLILHHARLSLMLGDHYYSSQDADQRWHTQESLHANTDRKSRALKQKLDEHLVGVAKAALKNADHLPQFETDLPYARANALKKPSSRDFKWQDKAARAITEWRNKNRQENFGFFVVNMASTGKGKTFANAKIMHALSPYRDRIRYTLALGLRTLTLQTGDEYRDRIGLDDSELAVLIGSSEVQELHLSNEKMKEDAIAAENLGSESSEPLLKEEIDFDCDLSEEGLDTVLTQQRDKQFLYAPVLACTIDHLVNATECVRGGRYILPSLRMMSADLVIDEIDDFSGSDLVAIGRLIFFAGLMGRKVMISSATIPPDMAEGYFKAYRDGYRLFAISRNQRLTIGSAWSDEFNTIVREHSESEVEDAITGYRQNHKCFIDERVKRLAKEIARRKAEIISTKAVFNEQSDQTKVENYFNAMVEAACTLHKNHHTKDETTGLIVSFGVLRIANIIPCVQLARYLLEVYLPQADTEIRVLCYHSQQTLLLRSEEERHLDDVLKRKERPNAQPKAFANQEIRQHLTDISQQGDIKQVLFILVATPVEEVGRDHDFDWAVLEPSSYRSIIQLAGRVRRHRAGEVPSPNIAIMQHNLKSVKADIQDTPPDEAKPCFTRPGFETKQLMLKSHDVENLIDCDQLAKRLDASPRIQKAPCQNHARFRQLGKGIPASSLSELEHAATWKLIASYAECNCNTDPAQECNCNTGPKPFQGYLSESWWLTGLPQKFHPFRSGGQGHNVYLTYQPDKEDYRFCEKDYQGDPTDREEVLGIKRTCLSDTAKKRLWLQRDFSKSVETKADELESCLKRVSLRYGELNFRYQSGKRYQYNYNDQLGLVKVNTLT